MKKCQKCKGSFDPRLGIKIVYKTKTHGDDVYELCDSCNSIFIARLMCERIITSLHYNNFITNQPTLVNE